MESSSFWTRKDVSCYCDALSYTHAHCPCTSCKGKAVARSTEHRHWLNANVESSGQLCRCNEQEEGTSTEPEVADEQDDLCMHDDTMTEGTAAESHEVPPMNDLTDIGENRYTLHVHTIIA